MRNIIIERAEARIGQKSVEIIERKGLGHPDSVCDACCEAASLGLSKYYLKNFGSVLHHNVDKGLLVAGKSLPRFGGGKIIEPARIIITGRATDNVSGKSVPVGLICREAAQKLLDELGIGAYFKITVDYEPGAVNLREVFTRPGEKGVAIANDTSFGVGHAPLSRAEQLVFDVANLLNSEEFVKRFPAVGKDIKVMALRKDNGLVMTLAIAFIDKHVSGMKEYFEIKDKVREEVYSYVKKSGLAADFDSIKIEINTLDNPKAESEQEVYLTVTGLSSENGDDGQVGRGNRPCGLITACREMSMEAAAGKNINHPGKLYQILSLIIAREIAKIEGVKDCEVKMLSGIGMPLDEPQVVDIKLVADDFDVARKKAIETVNSVLNQLPGIQKEIAEGKYSVF